MNEETKKEDGAAHGPPNYGSTPPPLPPKRPKTLDSNGECIESPYLSVVRYVTTVIAMIVQDDYEWEEGAEGSMDIAAEGVLTMRTRTPPDRRMSIRLHGMLFHITVRRNSLENITLLGQYKHRKMRDTLKIPSEVTDYRISAKEYYTPMVKDFVSSCLNNFQPFNSNAIQS